MKKAQIPNENAICVVCREGITNPICPECLAKEIKHWRPELSRLITKQAYGYTTEAKCMFCGEWMSICAHCYCRDIYDILIEEDPVVAEEFRDLFGLREELI